MIGGMKNRWDCHAHIFGPYEKFPLAENRSYTPPEATLNQYTDMLNIMGMTHGVLVHPSAYGDDHSLLLHVLAEQRNLRGVVVVRENSPMPIKGLYERGVRAARFSHRSGVGGNFSGSALMHDLLNLAPLMANEKMHAEIWTDCVALPDIASTLLTLPVPVVIDHMGGFDPQKGINEPGFQILLKLLDSGKIWIKLCAYRNLLNEVDWEIGRPFMQAMLDTRPDRLVWGSDWPHLRVSPKPNTSQLLELLTDWVGEKNHDLIDQILSSNAENLYK